MKPYQSNRPLSKKLLLQLLTGGLFVIFVINSIGCFIYFEIKRKHIRHEIKHNILHKLTDKQLIKITDNNYYDKEEFEINGIMYDVIRKEVINDQIILWCFEDKKETQLNHSIELLVKNDLANSPIKKTQKLLVNFLKTPLNILKNHLFYFQQKKYLKNIFCYISPFSATYKEVVSPPPDFS